MKSTFLNADCSSVIVERVEEITLHGVTDVLGCWVPCSLTITRVVGRGYALVFRCRYTGACDLEFVTDADYPPVPGDIA